MTRSQIIELMARAMFPTVYDDARSRWQVTQKERKGTAYNKARAAFDALTAAGLAILPIEPSEKMIEAASNCDALDWSLEPGEGLDGVNYDTIYDAMVDADMKEQEGRD